MKTYTNTISEIRKHLSWMIEKISDRNDIGNSDSFFAQAMETYWYDIGGDETDGYDVEKFWDEIFVDWCNWLDDKYTDKFDAMTDEELMDMYGECDIYDLTNDDVFNLCDDIEAWWNEKYTEFKPEHYILDDDFDEDEDFDIY